ncbi:MAG TPA: response regulator, partial [Terriglobales bacterium]|nr:response regulator [Terriglobales bacterium]
DQLESLGYGVLLAGDGPKAIEIFRENPGIDLLLTDLIMPGGMNGMAVAEQAWKLRPGLPVLFTSGYTENAALHQGSIGPGTHLLQKPYRKQDLATKIRMVLEEARKKAT